MGVSGSIFCEPPRNLSDLSECCPHPPARRLSRPFRAEINWGLVTQGCVALLLALGFDVPPLQGAVRLAFPGFWVAFFLTAHAQAISSRMSSSVRAFIWSPKASRNSKQLCIPCNLWFQFLTTESTEHTEWGGVGVISVGDALDAEFGMFEVEEEGGFEAGDVEVSEHLGEVAVVESGDDLGIHDDRLFDDEVGDEGANVVGVVVDREILLLFAGEALLGKFDDEGAFVEFFIEAGLEGEEYFVGGSNDFFGEVVGFHEIF